MKKLTKYFFNGIALLVPMAATVYFVYIIFIKIDNLYDFPVPGMGFIITILIITAVGFIGSNLLTKKLIGIFDLTFTRLPLIKMIYTSIKDLIGAFVGDKKGFTKPVLVSLSPESNVQVIGFMTNESLNHLGLSDSAAVYLPQSYNFAGNLIIVPKEQITPLSADSTDIMKFIISGGISKK